MRKILVSIYLLFVVVSIGYSQVTVPFNQKNIAYSGRIETIGNQYVRIYWPGTSATLNFKGTEAKAILKNDTWIFCFYAIVDGDAKNATKIKPDDTKKSYVLAANLPDGKHSVQLLLILPIIQQSLLFMALNLMMEQRY